MASFQFVAMFNERIEDGQLYLTAHGVKVDSVLPKPDSLPIDATPTLLLVMNGKVQDVWAGYLDPVGESAVARSIKRLCPACRTPVS